VHELHPFTVGISDAALADTAARLKSARWIDDLFDGDWRFGAPLPFVRALRDHWLNSFDWRALEARINRETNVTGEIDGVTIHSVHRRSTRSDAVPLLMLHGWPGAFLEFLELYDPLAEPAADQPAFHVVTPSLPGYGFSTTRKGMNPARMAPVFVALMERLGYERFIIQGGNWGAVVGTEIARQFPERVIGLHLNSVNGSPPPDRDSLPLTAEERSWIVAQGHYAAFTHFALLAQAPVSPAHALNDSPVGLAAWLGERFHDWADKPAGGESAIALDRMVAIIALYWYTGTIASSGFLYYEQAHHPSTERFVTVPTAGAIFPKGLVRLPRSWAQRHYNIVRWKVFARGGHFPAMEVPELLIADLRDFAASLESN
jgi:microsomal epoxide hydrolase